MQLLIFSLLPSTDSSLGSHLRAQPRRVVGSNGLGPSTSRLSGVCSNQLSYAPAYGGGNRVRTDDPLLAGQVLYQLSYTPIRSLLDKINAPFFLGALLLKTNKKETRNFQLSTEN